VNVELPSYEIVEAGAVKLRTFRCERQAVTLSDRGCADRWRAAQKPHQVAETRERLDECMRCPLGAVHAGVEPIHVARHYGSPICPRCGHHSMRMIGGTRCVGCYNREREFVSGVNGRGNPIQRVIPVYAVALRLVVDNDRPRQVHAMARETSEVVLATIRRTKGHMVFSAFRGRPDRQLELAFA
jgi:hypothetical protein